MITVLAPSQKAAHPYAYAHYIATLPRLRRPCPLPSAASAVAASSLCAQRAFQVCVESVLNSTSLGAARRWDGGDFGGWDFEQEATKYV